MTKKTQSKIMLFLMIFAILQMLISCNTFAQRAVLDEAIERFRNRQFGTLGAGWLIRFVGKSKAYLSIATDNIDLYNNVEKNLKQSINIDEIDKVTIDLKGPKGGVPEETRDSMAKHFEMRTTPEEIESYLSLAASSGILDVDGNRESNALSDGILVIRYIAGFRGEKLVNDAVDPEGTRTQAEAIADYLALVIQSYALDANGDGYTELSEALLTTRYLAGFRGDALVNGLDLNNHSYITGNNNAVIGSPHYAHHNHILDYMPSKILNKDLRESSRLKSSSLSLSINSLNDKKLAFDNITLPYGSEDYLNYNKSQDELKQFQLNNEDTVYFETNIHDKSLEDNMKDLQKKTAKTDIETKMLEVTRTVIRDEDYIDEETIDDFKKAINLIAMVKSLKDILEGVDFTAITYALNHLAEGHKILYEQYMSKTEKVYEKLLVLLDVSPEKWILPDKYLSISGMSEKEKRQILINLALEEIIKKDEQKLLKNEKQALRIYKDILLPLQNKYREDLKQALEEFIFAVKKAIMDIAPVSISRNKGQFKSLFILDSR